MIMNISSETLDILKNFSEINNSILINPGNELKTMSPLKNVLARVKLKDKFPKQGGIYNLSEFIGVVSAMESPSLDFNEVAVKLKSSKGTLKYFYSDPSTIVYPEKDIEMPDADIEFEVTADDYASIMKMALTLNLSDIMVKGCSKSKKIYLCTLDRKSDTSNDFSVEVGDTEKDFNLYFKAENFKMVKGDYKVRVTSKCIAHFTHESDDLEYWVALEPDSKYE